MVHTQTVGLLSTADEYTAYSTALQVRGGFSKSNDNIKKGGKEKETGFGFFFGFSFVVLCIGGSWRWPLSRELCFREHEPGAALNPALFGFGRGSPPVYVRSQRFV